jgi:hypothetical protein
MIAPKHRGYYLFMKKIQRSLITSIIFIDNSQVNTSNNYKTSEPSLKQITKLKKTAISYQAIKQFQLFDVN